MGSVFPPAVLEMCQLTGIAAVEGDNRGPTSGLAIACSREMAQSRVPADRGPGSRPGRASRPRCVSGVGPFCPRSQQRSFVLLLGRLVLRAAQPALQAGPLLGPPG